MKKTKILVTAIIIAILFTLSCFAADTIFFGFEDENLTSSMTPNFSWTSSGVMTANVTSSDPYIDYRCSIYADDYDKVVIRMKHDLNERSDGKKPVCQVYYVGTDASGNALSLSESNSVSVPLVGLSTNDEFVIYELPLNNAKLKGATLSKLRFDIVSNPGSFGIDYIMLAPKKLYRDDNSEGWIGENLSPEYSSITVKDGYISGINAADNGLIKLKSISPMLKGSDYPKVYVRMKTSGLKYGTNSVFYTNLLDKDGKQLKNWLGTYDGYKNVYSTHNSGNDGKWLLHTFDFSGKSAYMNNYFSYLVFNAVSAAETTFYIDYIAFKNINNYEWNFDLEDFTEGWTKPSGFSVSGND